MTKRTVNLYHGNDGKQTCKQTNKGVIPLISKMTNPPRIKMSHPLPALALSLPKTQSLTFQPVTSQPTLPVTLSAPVSFIGLAIRNHRQTKHNRMVITLPRLRAAQSLQSLGETGTGAEEKAMAAGWPMRGCSLVMHRC